MQTSPNHNGKMNRTILNSLRWLLALSALILTCIGLSASACSFIKCGSPPTSFIGLWHYQQSSDKKCQSYPNDVSVDGFWMSARVFSISSLVFATLVFALELYHVFGKKRVVDGLETFTTLYLLLYGYLMTGTVQGLTLLFLLSSVTSTVVEEDDSVDVSCSISTGGKYIIATTSLWFAAAIASFLSLVNTQMVDGAKSDDGRTISLSTEPLLISEVYDVDNEANPNSASGSRPKRKSDWKDVVNRISDTGEIDLDELDDSLYDEEIYASVNEASVDIEADSNRASGSRPKRRSDWKDVLTRLSDTGEIDLHELDNTSHDEEVYASVNEAV